MKFDLILSRSMEILEPESAANEAFEGILRNKVLLSLPSKLLISVMKIWTIRFQQMFRDIVIKDME